METHFKVAKYEKNYNGFTHKGYDSYLVSYIKGNKPNKIRIVVDGLLTNKSINLIDGKSGYKSQILSAISDVKNGKINITQIVSEKKKVKLSYIETHSKLILNNVNSYLMPINKEESRDILTKFELI